MKGDKPLSGSIEVIIHAYDLDGVMQNGSSTFFLVELIADCPFMIFFKY